MKNNFLTSKKRNHNFSYSVKLGFICLIATPLGIIPISGNETYAFALLSGIYLIMRLMRKKNSGIRRFTYLKAEK